MYIRIYIYIYRYACMCVHMYVCTMYVCTYVCTYIHTYIRICLVRTVCIKLDTYTFNHSAKHGNSVRLPPSCSILHHGSSNPQ